jgi:hypothetical protein
VPSSTSSSKQRLPRLVWTAILGGGLSLLLITAGLIEWRLAARGFRPSLADTEARWLHERRRADALGEHALILIGASRMQTDVDLDVLRRETGLEPVQLALVASADRPVLAGLAADAHVRGTVVVEFLESTEAGEDSPGVGAEYEQDYERKGYQGWNLDFDSSEAYLSDRLHLWLRSYADGARPLTTLLTRLLETESVPQYISLQADRGRSADYRRVPMPEFYFQRVVRVLDEPVDLPPGISLAQFEALMQERIAALKPVDNGVFVTHIRELTSLAAAIEGRGGRVLFVLMPSSGDVQKIFERQFPPEQFWDVFAQASHAAAVNFADMPALREFRCPDGTHLDQRDRAAFTEALVGALGLRKSQ